MFTVKRVSTGWMILDDEGYPVRIVQSKGSALRDAERRNKRARQRILLEQQEQTKEEAW